MKSKAKSNACQPLKQNTTYTNKQICLKCDNVQKQWIDTILN